MPKRALPCCRTSSRTVGDRRAWRKRFEGRCSLIATIPPRRDARAAESDGLENHCGATHRGFKSHPLRHGDVAKHRRRPEPQRGRGVCCRDGGLRLQPEHSRENRRLRTIKEPTEPVDRPEVNGKRSGLRLFAFYVVVTLVPIAV